MIRRALTLALLALCCAVGTADAQMFSARRMAMGGAVLAGGGPGSDAANVAYRAVPRIPGSAWELTLPIGLVQTLTDPPQLDPKQPDFNLYELANLLYNPPWNLQLVSPTVPSNDVRIDVARDRLSVDIGDVRRVFPPGQGRFGAIANGPAPGFGLRRFFVAVAPLVQYQNEMTFNDALRRVVDGEELQPGTTYTMHDDALGQAAVGAHLGWAAPLMVSGDPRGAGQGVYAGARVKLMRGLAYAEARNVTSFTTGDPIFAAGPVDADYTGHYYQAGPDGGGFGRGLDVGAVWLARGFELGLGVNDLGTTFDWRVRESVAHRDSSGGGFVHETLAENQPLTSTVPTTVTANAAAHVRGVLIAMDVVRGIEAVTGHLGVEAWLHDVPLRVGALRDANQQFQFTAGSGVRLGRFGVDVAVASHSRNLTRERALELGLGLALYR